MQRLEFNHNGRISGWICAQCKLYNDILREVCCYCLIEKRDGGLEYVSELTRAQRTGMAIDDKDVELFTKFFNDEARVVNGMDLPTLMAHIEELEKIAFEAKARISKASGEKRARIDKLSKEEREKLINNPELDIANSDSLIRKRAERISKADKMINNFAGLGLPEEVIKSLMSNVKIDETANNGKGSGTPALPPKQQFTFNKPSATNEKKVNDTQESLLADVSGRLIDGLVAISVCEKAKENLANVMIQHAIEPTHKDVVKANEALQAAITKVRKEEDLVEAAKTAGHIANKILGVFKEVIPVPKVEVKEEVKKPFWEWK